MYVRLSVCLSVCVSVRTHLNGRNDVLFAEKCILHVCEKLTVFPYGQDIVGNVVLLAFWRYSQVQDRSGALEEMYKNVTVITSWHRPVYSLFIQGGPKKLAQFWYLSFVPYWMHCSCNFDLLTYYCH